MVAGIFNPFAAPLDSGEGFIPCKVLDLPSSFQEIAAQTAVLQNPANAPTVRVMAAMGMEIPTPQHIAVMTQRYWGTGGVKLTVGFMESIQDDLASRILLHMNAWGKFSNVQFVRSKTDPQVRITRNEQGYWSYLGTDILHIPKNKPTLCLQGFTMQTRESEFVRVIRHEAGHTLGCPHEHMRKEIVNRLDVEKTIQYFWRTQGWNATQVRQQVLTPINENEIIGSTSADEVSIMTYQLPGEITKNGEPILGGMDFSQRDMVETAKLYPLPGGPKPPIEPPTKPVPPTKPDGGNMSNWLIQLLLASLKSQIEKWLQDGTIQKWIEDLLNRIKANRPQTLGELQLHVAQAAYNAGMSTEPPNLPSTL